MMTKKEIILRESFTLFLSKGYDAVSISEIESASNVSRGAIFHHFANKEDIFNHVADRFVFEFLEETNYRDEYLDSISPLKSFMDMRLERIQMRMENFLQESDSQITAASFMRFTLYLRDHYTGWSDRVRAYEAQELELWETVIDIAKERREIRADANTILLAETLYHLYLGLSYKGALVDKLSLVDLRKLWEFVYEQEVVNQNNNNLV